MCLNSKPDKLVKREKIDSCYEIESVLSMYCTVENVMKNRCSLRSDIPLLSPQSTVCGDVLAKMA